VLVSYICTSNKKESFCRSVGWRPPHALVFLTEAFNCRLFSVFPLLAALKSLRRIRTSISVSPSYGNPLKAHALHSCSEGIDDYPLQQVEKKLTSPNSPQSIDHMTAGYQYYGL